MNYNTVLTDKPSDSPLTHILSYGDKLAGKSHYQRRGYGKEALRLFLQFIQDHYPQCQALQLTVHPENEHAQRLYIDVGFQPTGKKILLGPRFCIIEPAEEPTIFYPLGDYFCPDGNIETCRNRLTT
ncbi:GNAT family N-acetyltransferase [Dictyobacter arantiisoli]|uniref:GNAT family N-acetyltransferase n=1 Tax=Dictyobacter arantiisoli TaxID=2014874 RepID=UPI0011EE8668